MKATSKKKGAYQKPQTGREKEEKLHKTKVAKATPWPMAEHRPHHRRQDAKTVHASIQSANLPSAEQLCGNAQSLYHERPPPQLHTKILAQPAATCMFGMGQQWSCRQCSSLGGAQAPILAPSHSQSRKCKLSNSRPPVKHLCFTAFMPPPMKHKKNDPRAESESEKTFEAYESLCHSECIQEAEIILFLFLWQQVIFSKWMISK